MCRTRFAHLVGSGAEPQRPAILVHFRSKRKPLSSGCDNISMAIIKHTESCIAMPLAYICNLSIVNAHVPSGMKIAKITPIFKSDAPDEFSNYRPISLLPNFSKILEKLIFNRMVDFLDKYNILYENQYGFRPNYSTICR